MAIILTSSRENLPMIGPVYALEWKNAGRHVQHYSWRWVYIGLLWIEMAVLIYETLFRSGAELAFIFEGTIHLLLAVGHKCETIQS